VHETGRCVSVGEWVTPDKYRPHDGEIVWFCVGGVVLRGEYRHPGEFFLGYQGIEGAKVFGADEVTYWMPSHPCPKPPKEGGQHEP